MTWTIDTTSRRKLLDTHHPSSIDHRATCPLQPGRNRCLATKSQDIQTSSKYPTRIGAICHIDCVKDSSN